MSKPDKTERATRAALWVAWRTAKAALALVDATDDQARYETLSGVVDTLNRLRRGLPEPVLPEQDLLFTVPQMSGGLEVAMVAGDTLTLEAIVPLTLAPGSKITGTAIKSMLLPGEDLHLRVHGRAGMTMEVLDSSPMPPQFAGWPAEPSHPSVADATLYPKPRRSVLGRGRRRW